MYLMESAQEAHRLQIKTDAEAVIRQATWAGISEGMRVLDMGCGSGAATQALGDLVGPSGAVVGVDMSSDRLSAAMESNNKEWVCFTQHNINAPYLDEKPFDAVWSRFFLEYFKPDQQLQTIKNMIASLRPDGILFLGDLDHNCLNHFGHNDNIQQTLEVMMDLLQCKYNFDPYVGRRLYHYLYRLGYSDIACHMESHHLIYGEINDVDLFNWVTKIEVAAARSGCSFTPYAGDIEAFKDDFTKFFKDPSRFTYTPLIIVRGRRQVKEGNHR